MIRAFNLLSATLCTAVLLDSPAVPSLDVWIGLLAILNTYLFLWPAGRRR